MWSYKTVPLQTTEGISLRPTSQDFFFYFGKTKILPLPTLPEFPKVLMYTPLFQPHWKNPFNNKVC